MSIFAGSGGFTGEPGPGFYLHPTRFVLDYAWILIGYIDRLPKLPRRKEKIFMYGIENNIHDVLHRLR